MKRREIRTTIGRQIGSWIAYFIDQLFGHRCYSDSAACAGVFGYYERSVRFGFYDWIADVIQRRNGFPIDLAIAAAALCAALNGVAGNDARGEFVPLVRMPSKF